MIAVLVAAAGLALSACGDDEDDATSSEETSAAVGNDMMSGFTSCVEEQGIELPEDWAGGFGGGGEMPSFDPENAPSGMPTDMPSDMPSDFPTDMGGGGGFSGGFTAPEGVSDEDWQAALETCSSELPFGGDFPQDGAPGTDDLTAYRDCLAERGVELGDDVSALDSSDPDVAAAMADCEALAPADS